MPLYDTQRTYCCYPLLQKEREHELAQALEKRLHVQPQQPQQPPLPTAVPAAAQPPLPPQFQQPYPQYQQQPQPLHTGELPVKILSFQRRNSADQVVFQII